MLSPEVLNEQYRHLGLKFDRPMGEVAAKIMADSKRAEIVRDNIISRGPQGPGTFILQLGASLMASAVDPIELASVFIPIVGQARMAGIIARRGRVLGRAQVGLIEGAGGNVLVGPGFIALSNQLQLDYEFSDSLLNVFLGATLGAGIGGAIGTVSRVRARNRRREVQRVIEELAGLDELDLTPQQRGQLGLPPQDARPQLEASIATRKARIKDLKVIIKERTRALDQLRKEGRLEDPEVQVERERLAGERTAAEADQAREAKELRVEQKRLNDVDKPELLLNAAKSSRKIRFVTAEENPESNLPAFIIDGDFHLLNLPDEIIFNLARFLEPISDFSPEGLRILSDATIQADKIAAQTFADLKQARIIREKMGVVKLQDIRDDIIFSKTGIDRDRFLADLDSLVFRLFDEAAILMSLDETFTDAIANYSKINFEVVIPDTEKFAAFILQESIFRRSLNKVFGITDELTTRPANDVPIDPATSGDAFRAALAQALQGKSVDVSEITDPVRRALLQEIKEKAAEVKRLKRAEGDITRAIPVLLNIISSRIS